ncbi:MAG: zf-HC2 domain-containing protein [Bryobacteraceae bacterium]|nr:zf-HC2 domain-containing protein [Bryobacteraceae bacterium]
MLTCKDFLRQVSEFLDGTCDQAMKRDLEKHVNECPNCWVVFDTTKKTLKVFKGMEPKELPSAIRDRLMNALTKKMAAKKCEHSHQDSHEHSEAATS